MKKVLRYSRTQSANYPPQQAFKPIQRIGGHTGWYFANWLWRIRGFLDRCFGGVGFRRDQRGPELLQPGDIVDFWRVEAFEQDRLLRLVAEAKMPGRGWLQFEVEAEGSGSLVRLLALFEPKGLLGYAYWYSLFPVHWLMFRGMLRALVREMGTGGEAGSSARNASARLERDSAVAS
jgi:hypothetical protein